ncbi:uncharacterized protein [Amphiura filiformis]|uniref:uncharacterized protein n=1 Tax=Amphiura filiformis TaxID=82378 RepID=UPI003B21ABE3
MTMNRPELQGGGIPAPATFFHTYEQRAAKQDPIRLLRACNSVIGKEEDCAIALVSYKELHKATIALENSIIDAFSCGLTEDGTYLSSFQVGERVYVRFMEFGNLSGVGEKFHKMNENLISCEVMTPTDLTNRRTYKQDEASGAGSSKTKSGRQWGRTILSNKLSVNNMAKSLSSLPDSPEIKHLGLLVYIRKKQVS